MSCDRLVTRDIDVLQSMAERRQCHVTLSVTTLDQALARDVEDTAEVALDRADGDADQLAFLGHPQIVLSDHRQGDPDREHEGHCGQGFFAA